MFNYFKGSFIVTVFGLVLAFFWGEHAGHGLGFKYLFIALVLSVLEVSLSFDNAVVNAIRLEHMSPIWRKRFLTWGIAIAVFGMRFVFPILIVSIFASLPMISVVDLALNNPVEYAVQLHHAHVNIVSFGGMFLLMLFLTFMANQDKQIHWLRAFEEKFQKFASLKYFEVIIAVLLLFVMQSYLEQSVKLPAILSGLAGLVVYLLIEGLSHWMETKAEKSTENQAAGQLAKGLKYAGFVSFLYLELIDASFSLDGVLGAFAITKDIIIITIGLAIGAMFVRSLTILLVEKKTLKQFIYLEHGAHWAIGALAVIMLYSTIGEVSEFITGTIGLSLIIASLICSVLRNIKEKHAN